MDSMATPGKTAQALLLDLLFGIYLVLTLHRVVWYRVVLYTTPGELSLQAFLAYCAVGAALGTLLYVIKASPGRKVFGLLERNTWRDTLAQNVFWIMGVTTVITAWIVTKISLIDFFSARGLGSAGRIFGALFTPEFSIFSQALSAMIETIYLALIATVLALPLSFVLSFLSARNLMKHSGLTFAIYNIVRLITNFTRSIEPLIWAIVFSVWVGIGPFAGMLALMVHTVSSLIKLYSEQIENIETGPIEAIEATGARPLQVIWFAVVPQIVIPFLSFTIYRWDINVRMATVIGLVGGGGIGTLLMQYQGLAMWNEVGLIVLMIACVVWLMDYVSAKIREAIQ